MNPKYSIIALLALVPHIRNISAQNYIFNPKTISDLPQIVRGGIDTAIIKSQIRALLTNPLINGQILTEAGQFFISYNPELPNPYQIHQTNINRIQQIINHHNFRACDDTKRNFNAMLAIRLQSLEPLIALLNTNFRQAHIPDRAQLRLNQLPRRPENGQPRRQRAAAAPARRPAQAPRRAVPARRPAQPPVILGDREREARDIQRAILENYEINRNRRPAHADHNREVLDLQRALLGDIEANRRRRPIPAPIGHGGDNPPAVPPRDHGIHNPPVIIRDNPITGPVVPPVAPRPPVRRPIDTLNPVPGPVPPVIAPDPVIPPIMPPTIPGPVDPTIARHHDGTPRCPGFIPGGPTVVPSGSTGRVVISKPVDPSMAKKQAEENLHNLEAAFMHMNVLLAALRGGLPRPTLRNDIQEQLQLIKNLLAAIAGQFNERMYSRYQRAVAALDRRVKELVA